MTTAHEIGNRAIPDTVGLFKAITGVDLSEENGLLFAALAFQNGMDWQKRPYNFQDLSNKKYGRLSVIGASANSKKGQAGWVCRCVCGNLSDVLASNLRGGRQRSCGCLRDETRKQRALEQRKPEADKRANELARKARYSASAKGKMAQRRYFNANRDEVMERSREWAKKNPEAGRAATRNRRARFRNADGSHTKADIHLIGSEQNWSCAVCDIDIANSYHADHVVPISRGGSNWPSNIQLLCATCNVRKSTKPLEVFLSEVWPSLFRTKGDSE